ncbi:hypothetical protein BKA81DRAFT_80032 [Phyllosticta paracitricarpa]
MAKRERVECSQFPGLVCPNRRDEAGIQPQAASQRNWRTDQPRLQATQRPRLFCSLCPSPTPSLSPSPSPSPSLCLSPSLHVFSPQQQQLEIQYAPMPANPSPRPLSSLQSFPIPPVPPCRCRPSALCTCPCHSLVPTRPRLTTLHAVALLC